MSAPDQAPEQAEVRRLANAIRVLTLDAVETAKSGHPGLPLGMADVATVLFRRFLKHDAADPAWPDRDRFILSGGHGSMLLYSLLWLMGYPKVTIDELKHFRKVGSPTAGHPEYGHLPGIETTTGPLGQGIGNSVGFALAEAILNARFGPELVAHKTYVIASDGDLMEGISQEAITLAGHLRLKNLIVMWDHNNITIDGAISLADSTDQLERFRAAGWTVDACDGHDAADIARALDAAQDATRPVLIACKTIIGFGMPGRQGTQKAHSDAPGAEIVAGARKELDWPYEPFVVPDDILKDWRAIGSKGAAARKDWLARKAGSPKAKEFDDTMAGVLPQSLDGALLALKQKIASEKPSAGTRKMSEQALNVINAELPFTIGGSADLTPSNNTRTRNISEIGPDRFDGRYVHYGIREHGMCAAMNGMALHGGILPYGGTFMVFSDYCRPAIRLAALMGIRVVFVMTHDSIGVGEDGPTHQPVEHLAALRAIPNLLVMRPADGVETAECWELAVKSENRPSLIAFSRQDVPTLRENPTAENLCARGAYVLVEDAAAKVTLLASGTEVSLAMEARVKLAAEGIAARVVSMPSWLLFEAQPLDYRRAVLGPGTVKVAIEAAVREGWDRYIGSQLLDGEAGAFIGMHSFGASGPYKDVYAKFGITADAAVAAAKKLLGK
ncbi:MAG: transketolase [Alphaproteobacteria bacterium 64-11]|nr:MAG: transketolase [Alphaproteobacteria bacterium 64-11]